MNKQQTARHLARQLRSNPTKAEKVLWEELRNKQFMGYKFLFQHPIFYKKDDGLKFFIADFYCHKLRLIIEVDGGIHENQREYDRIRTELLVSKEMKVIRFKNKEVLRNINKILICIKEQISPNQIIR